MRTFSVLIALCVAITLTACSKDEPAPAPKPIAQPASTPAAAVQDVKETLSSGQAIYTKNCLACHKLGVAGAPKTGDKDAWASRISEGVSELMDNAINGVGKMPPKGGNSKLTDKEVRAAVEYMIGQSS